MNTNFIFNFLSGAGVDQERFYSHINFENISGSIVKNSIYKNEIQFGTDASGNYIINEYHPAIFTSCYKYSNILNSGLFDGSNSLKLNQRLNSGEMSILLNYINNSSGTPLPGKNKVLIDFSSSNKTADQFSYSISLTDKNDMLVEFSGCKNNITEYKKKFVKDYLPDKNLICLSINNNQINLFQLDVNMNTIFVDTLKINQDYSNLEKNIYFGNKYNFIKNNHTGFSGVIQDIIAINQILDQNQLLNLSKIVAQTGEVYSGVNLINDPYKIYYSGKLNPTGIIGTGIIRYDRVIQDTLNINCGSNSNCNIYALSGVTGFLTGYKMEYSAQEEILQNFSYSKIFPTYNPSVSNNYSDYNIKNLLIDNNSIFEIQTYNDDLKSNLYTGSGVNYLPEDLNYIFYNGKINKDFITGTNYLYVSGGEEVLSVSNSENTNVNGLYKISGLYNYTRYINEIPVLTNKKNLYISSNYNYFIRWTDVSGWTIVGNNYPIYGSYENKNTPDQVENWFSYSGYLNVLSVKKSYGYINLFNKKNMKSLYFPNYTIGQLVPNTEIDLTYFNKYNIFLDGIKLIESKDYYKIDNSIRFNFNINNKKLLILEDSYKERITGSLNNLNINTSIYPKKHLLWVDGLLKINGIDYNNQKYISNGGYFNKIEQNNIQILIK